MQRRPLMLLVHAQALLWSGTGLCEAGSHAPWILPFLQCCLQSANNEVAIVEDAHKDARFIVCRLHSIMTRMEQCLPLRHVIVPLE